MDSWLGPRIGREEMRPYFEYLPFYAQQRAYTRLLNEVEPGEVITPSPLLTFQNDLFPLHFQIDQFGVVTSPQVPTGNWRDLAEGSLFVVPGSIDARQPLLDRVQRTLAPVQIETCVMQAEDLLARLMGNDRVQFNDSAALAQLPALGAQVAQMPGQTIEQSQTDEQALVDAAARFQTLLPPVPQTPPQQVQEWAAGNQQRAEVQNAISKADLNRRAQKGGYTQQEQSSNAVQMKQQTAQVFIEPQQGAEVVSVESVEVGELVPVWIGEAPMPQGVASVSQASRPTDSQGQAQIPAPVPGETLVFLRRVRIGESTVYQGVLCDWTVLRAALRDQISDLFPKATLAAAPNPTPALMESGRMLGTAPVTLDAPCPSIASGSLMTPARTTLGLTWLAMIGAIVAAGITLRSSILYGEKRSRFASAVTHELRTPLTTFRMYSEMLAEGMVRDEDQRKTYLQTLQQESGRLSTLVENVLTYARLEEGRSAGHTQTMSVADLLSRVRDVLQRRADAAGMQLAVCDHTRESGGTGVSPVTGSPSVSVDPDALEQVLFNLVDNACKYARDAENKRIEVDVRQDAGSGLSVTVRDHGPGISPEHQRAIFRAFDRGAHGPGDTVPGVGLGLALARGLARDMGGDLSLERCPDALGGACFRLTIPGRSGA
jgi:signal transduction histidine kinase